MKTKIFLVLATALAFIACRKNEDHKEGVDTPLSQNVLFTRYYINYAWGYQHAGYFIDRNGQIRTYSQQGLYPDFKWNFADENGFIAEEAMSENLNQTEISKTQIDINTLNKYAKKISLINEKSYTETQSRNDAGAVVSACYLYDEKSKIYKKIILSVWGDWDKINNHPVAKEIDTWLKTITVEN